MQGEPEQCRGRLRAVDESKAFFRRQRERRESGACERCRAGLAPIVMPGLAFADEHERQVREWREIAARANRSARWHNGMHAAIQQVDEASSVRRRMPEKPFASTFARRAIVARTLEPEAGRRRRQRDCEAG